MSKSYLYTKYDVSLIARTINKINSHPYSSKHRLSFMMTFWTDLREYTMASSI